MTTHSMTARGERRYYTYAPLPLDPTAVWKNLLHCQFAASQALCDIRVAWDREEEDTLTIAFANTRGERFESCWAVRVDDPVGYDEADPAAVARFALRRTGWTIESSLFRVSDQCEMDNDAVVGEVNERLVMVEDIWPALRALHASVCAHSERIYGICDPQEPLFWNNAYAATDEAHPHQSGAILAEKRVLAYEDYPLNLGDLDLDLSQREQTALGLMADIHIVWEQYGDPSTTVTFIAPNKTDFDGDVVPVLDREPGAELCWHVEVHSNQTTQLMKRKDVYCTLPSGEQVTFEVVTGVMVVLHQLLTQCEEDGYPAFDEQMV